MCHPSRQVEELRVGADGTTTLTVLNIVPSEPEHRAQPQRLPSLRLFSGNSTYSQPDLLASPSGSIIVCFVI
jgi:hypothetical protein